VPALSRPTRDTVPACCASAPSGAASASSRPVQEREERLKATEGLRRGVVGMAPSLPESRRVVIASGAVITPERSTLVNYPKVQ